jgi:hypothetical protein
MMHVIPGVDSGPNSRLGQEQTPLKKEKTHEEMGGGGGGFQSSRVLHLPHLAPPSPTSDPS